MKKAGSLEPLAISFSLATLFALGVSLRAQGKPDASPLADKQDVVKERVSRLEDRMFQISQAIRKSEPEKAGRLLESLGAARGMAVRQKMEEIVKKLRGEQYSDASEAQEAVLADLQTLLKMMLDEPDRHEERKDEIKKLQAVRETLEKIITEQRQEKSDAEASATSKEQAQALQSAIAKAKDLLNRQRDLTAKTAKPDARPPDQSAEQSKLRKEAESVAEKTKSLPGQPAAEELSGAAQKMKAAEDWLLKDQVPDARESQKEAEEKLEQAIQRLERQAKKLAEKRPLDQQASSQRETAGKTKDLSGEMKSEGADSQKSSEKGGKEQGKKSPDQQQDSGEQSPMKGQQDVEQASRLQEDAAEKLQAEKPDDAVKKQEEALKKLEQAQQQLADTLEQLRKEQQEEMLAALEARFRAMLAKQMDISKATGRLVELGKENWKRSHQLELGELSQKQKEIGDEADKALYVLTEEGTTVVFPQIVQQVRDDAREVGARLAAAEATADVRRMQDGIEQALRELIDAVKKKQEENESNQASASGGQEGPQPLLPGSAELKLLKSCQTRVNKATADLRVDRTKPDTRQQELKDRIEKLAKRQEEVSKLAKEMHEAMTKAQ